MRLRLAASVVALGAGCQAPQPGAEVYFRTRPLAEVAVRGLEDALQRQPFPPAQLAVGGDEGAPWRGTVRLERGCDGRGERERVLAWLRSRPEVAAAGEDSLAVFR